MKIKCIVHSGFGVYGTDVNSSVYNYIYNEYGKKKADELLERDNIDSRGMYCIRNRETNGSRFNSILIEAFENVPNPGKYRIIEGKFSCNNCKGIETAVKVVFEI